MAKHGYGTGQLYLEDGTHNRRWRALDGRKPNRKIRIVHGDTSTDGRTRAAAEHELRKLQEAEKQIYAPYARTAHVFVSAGFADEPATRDGNVAGEKAGA